MQLSIEIKPLVIDEMQARFSLCPARRSVTDCVIGPVPGGLPACVTDPYANITQGFGNTTIFVSEGGRELVAMREWSILGQL